MASLRAQKFVDEEQLGKSRNALTAIQTREAEDATSPDPQVTTDDATRKIQLDAEIKRLRSRISESGQRIVELENELAQEQRNLQQWEAMIDRRLGQR